MLDFSFDSSELKFVLHGIAFVTRMAYILIQFLKEQCILCS